MSHHCHAIDCNIEVPPKMHMCLKHWRLVPKAVQDLIWAHYRPGQEIDKQPTIDYICVAFVSISCVALMEGKPLPTMNKAVEAEMTPVIQRRCEHNRLDEDGICRSCGADRRGI